MNSVGEQITRMIRKVLESLLTRYSIWHRSAEEFRTLLKEAESILNNRPLEAAHDVVTDLSVIIPMALLTPVLIPAHLLSVSWSRPGVILFYF